MDENGDLIRRYVQKNDKMEDIFHSSAYGKAQSGQGIGTTTAQSFKQRQEIEERRNMVRGYGDSSVVNEARAKGPRARVYVPDGGGESGGPMGGSEAQAASRAQMARKNPGISR